MTKTSSLCVRVDSDTKEKAEAICGELGTTLSNAVNIYLTAIVRTNGFPFELKLETPNKETIAAMQEARALSHGNPEKYTDTKSLMNELLG